MIPGIPTSYNGTRFRSRLEARWAAMFDLLGWEAEYEPLDLDGYIPDFIIKFPMPLLVEVKPLIDRNAGVPFADKEKIGGAMGLDGSVLVLGAVLHETPDAVIAGWMMHHDPCSADAFELTSRETTISWHRDHWSPWCGEWRTCRARKCYPLDHPDVHRDLHFDHRTRLIMLWREAGNRVQWKGGR